MALSMVVAGSSAQAATVKLVPTWTGAKTISYTAAPGEWNDLLVVSASQTSITMADGGNGVSDADGQGGCTATGVPGAPFSCPLSSVSRIDVSFGDQHDIFHFSAQDPPATPRLNIDGGSGPDYIQGGTVADTLSGGPGYDSLFGGAGDDKVAGGADLDILEGGVGTDTVDYTDHSAGVFVGLDNSPYSGADASILGFENVIGSPGDDTIVGTVGANQIQGMGGQDIVNGGDGPDTLSGGPGHDTMSGEAGSDTLIGGHNGTGSPDFLDGGAGTDWVDYADQTGSVIVNLDNPYYSPTSDITEGVENVTGSQGDDTIIGDNGPNAIQSGGGSDTVQAGGGTDLIIDGAGGIDHPDRLESGDGNDIIVGGPGDDFYLPGEGADLVTDSLPGYVSGGGHNEYNMSENELVPDMVYCGSGYDFVATNDPLDKLFEIHGACEVPTWGYR